MTYSKGFSFIEILVSMIILSIAIAATFASYIAMARLRTFSENELEAYYNAQAWLEKVRTGSSIATRYSNLNDTENNDLNDPGSILQEDYNLWAMANKPKVAMSDTTYQIDDIDLGSGVIFKKITVEVKWNELD
jgi:prepilin-type N-terminal cleavage/methylation domain-containing protein